jgi:NAD(P)-dependent dehydrogenase (short-subunit alcohol dehydrogenase family)
VGELEGHAAIVTGGTTGLGFAIARAFLREGARLVFTGRDPELGRRAQVELRGGGEATFVRADAADLAAIADSTEQALELLGALDILVNNAGIGVAATLMETPIEDLDAVMAVNVRGYLGYARACFAHLRAAGGCMIHIGSDAGILGEVDIGAYSVSKAAVHMMSNMLAIEGGRVGVRSNVIAPGDTEPGMRHMGPPGDRDRAEDDPASWSLVPPVGRFGRADDVAEAAVYLASPRASFVNGIVLTIDGGMRAGLNTGLPPRAP